MSSQSKPALRLAWCTHKAGGLRHEALALFRVMPAGKTVKGRGMGGWTFYRGRLSFLLGRITTLEKNSGCRHENVQN